jgi:hypothetical protein
LVLYRSILDILLRKQGGYTALIPTQLINIAFELCRTNSDEDVFRREMHQLDAFINHFPSKTNLYEYIYIYLKMYKSANLTLAQLCQKKIVPNYAAKLQKETPANYIKWLGDTPTPPLKGDTPT